MASTQFRLREWEDPSKKLKAQAKTAKQFGQTEVNEFIDQQSGKMKVIQASHEAAAANFNFVVSDFVDAYKKVVDDRASSWKAVGKLLGQDLPKAYKAYRQQQRLIGKKKHATLDPTKPAGGRLNSTSFGTDAFPNLDQTDASNQFPVDQEPIITSNAFDPDLDPDIYSGSQLLDETDVVWSGQEQVMNAAALILDQDDGLSNYERAVALAGLDNHHQEQGFLQEYALEQGQNMEALSEAWIKENDQPIQVLVNGDWVDVVPSEMDLNTPMDVWLAVRKAAENDIMGDLLTTTKGGVELNTQFYVDKVDPIIDTLRERAVKARTEAFIQHRHNTEIQGIAKKLKVLNLSSAANKPEQLQNLFSQAFLSFKRADQGRGTYGALYKKWLGDTVKTGMGQVIEGKGNLGEYKQGLAQLKGVFAWTGKKEVPFTEAFPDIFGVFDSKNNTWSGLTAIELDIKKKKMEDRHATHVVTVDDLLQKAQTAKQEGKLDEYNNLKNQAVQLLPHTGSHHASLQTRIDKLEKWTPPKTGVDAHRLIQDRIKHNGGYLLTSDLTDIDTEWLENTFYPENPGMRSKILDQAPGYDPNFMGSGQPGSGEYSPENTIKKFLQSKSGITASSNDLGGKNGTNIAIDWFLKPGGERDKIMRDLFLGRVKGYEQLEGADARQLQNTANEIIMSRIADADKAYTEDNNNISPYTFSKTKGWIWHTQDRGDVNRTNTQQSLNFLRNDIKVNPESWKSIPNLDQIPGWNELTPEGNYSRVLIQAAKIAKKPVLEVAMANAAFWGEELQMPEGDIIQGEELKTQLLERFGINFNAQPESAEWRRQLRELDSVFYSSHGWAVNQLWNKDHFLHTHVIEKTGRIPVTRLPKGSALYKLFKDADTGISLSRSEFNEIVTKERKRLQQLGVEASFSEGQAVNDGSTQSENAVINRTTYRLDAKDLNGSETYAMSDGTLGWSSGDVFDSNRNQIIFPSAEQFVGWERVKNNLLIMTGYDINDRVISTSTDGSFVPLLPKSYESYHTGRYTVIEIDKNDDLLAKLLEIDPDGKRFGFNYIPDKDGNMRLIYLPLRNNIAQQVKAGM